jgi:hypothetical protein
MDSNNQTIENWFNARCYYYTNCLVRHVFLVRWVSFLRPMRFLEAKGSLDFALGNVSGWFSSSMGFQHPESHPMDYVDMHCFP